MDEDLKSLYPSITMAFNIDTTTQLGKARFSDQFNDEESIEFFDYMGARNYISMGKKYFNLPSASEIAELDL
jgi:DNA polymerase elongation subunit (family B)